MELGTIVRAAFTPIQRIFFDHSPALVAALLGTVLSVSVWLGFSLREDRLAALEFTAAANDSASLLENDINDYLDRIDALRGLFEAVQPVSKLEFSRFSRSLLDGFPAIRGLSWIPRVTRAERSQHEHAGKANGISNYEIKTLRPGGGFMRAPEADEYFPVFYNTGNENAPWLGLNLRDGGVRQEALERARDTGALVTSGSIVLLDRGGTGFLVLLPVYRPDAVHDTVGTRRANLIGYVQGVFQPNGMVESIVRSSGAKDAVDFALFPSPSKPDAPPFYVHSSQTNGNSEKVLSRQALETGIHLSRNLAIGDISWTFVATPALAGPGTSSRVASSLALIAGMLLTTALVAHLWSARRQASELEAANRELDKTMSVLAAQNVRFDAALNNMSQGLLMFDSSERILVCNNRYREMYGLPAEVVQPGRTLEELLRWRFESGLLNCDPEEMRANILSGVSRRTLQNFIIETGDGRTISALNSPMPHGGWLVTHEDITERRRAEAEIAHMARHDALTGLPNRRLFHEELTKNVDNLKPSTEIAVLSLDLDRFKSINDTLGHPIGDMLLKEAGKRLRTCAGAATVVARLGGDEFAMIQAGAAQPNGATSLAASVIQAVSAPYMLDGNQIVVGISVGIAIAPADGSEAHQLLKNADMALYRAKADGRGTYRFFEASMDARMQARRALELDLRRAIAVGEFELFYQPVVDVQTEEVKGFEALIRWRHPERGIIAPAEFVPLAEETGLIVPLGEWIIRQACTDAAKWSVPAKVAVNLSPVQFRSNNLLPTVVSALANSRLDPSRLELEITESVLLQEGSNTLDILRGLRSLGAQIALDDFGTGYSSLSYLRDFPIDKVKIDQSFIRDMLSRKECLAIVRAVATMCASLGIRTTAEGVETAEQAKALRSEGCTEYQGFYFSVPVAATEAKALLNRCEPGHKMTA